MMRMKVASRIMRTTIDIDDPILRDLKRLQEREGKSLGRIVSDLLAQSLAVQRPAEPEKAKLRWITAPMGARVNLADKDAVQDALDDGPA